MPFLIHREFGRDHWRPETRTNCCRVSGDSYGHLSESENEYLAKRIRRSSADQLIETHAPTDHDTDVPEITGSSRDTTSTVASAPSPIESTAGQTPDTPSATGWRKTFMPNRGMMPLAVLPTALLASILGARFAIGLLAVLLLLFTTVILVTQKRVRELS